MGCTRAMEWCCEPKQPNHDPNKTVDGRGSLSPLAIVRMLLMFKNNQVVGERAGTCLWLISYHHYCSIVLASPAPGPYEDYKQIGLALPALETWQNTSLAKHHFTSKVRYPVV